MSRFRSVIINGVWKEYWIYWRLVQTTGTTHTSNYNNIPNLQTLQITTSPAKPFPACYVLTSCSLATASNGGDSSASSAQVLPAISSGTLLTLLITFRQEPCRKHSFHCCSPTIFWFHYIYKKPSHATIYCKYFTQHVSASFGHLPVLLNIYVYATGCSDIEWNILIVASVFVAVGTCLPNLCHAVYISSGSTFRPSGVMSQYTYKEFHP
jgi:hypothetical protein